MTERTYPCDVWILTPSFKPKVVTLTTESTWSTSFAIMSSSKEVRLADAYPTKSAAIAAGRAKLERVSGELEKRMAVLKKRRAQLDKAESEKEKS